MKAQSLQLLLERIIEEHGPDVEVVCSNIKLGQMPINNASYNKDENKLVLGFINYSSIFH